MAERPSTRRPPPQAPPPQQQEIQAPPHVEPHRGSEEERHRGKDTLGDVLPEAWDTVLARGGPTDRDELLGMLMALEVEAVPSALDMLEYFGVSPTDGQGPAAAAQAAPPQPQTQGRPRR